MSIGQRLEQVRRQTGLSQAKFGERFGVSDRTYKNYEAEITEIPVSVVLKICEEEKISLVWLLKGEGAMKNAELQEAVKLATTTSRGFFIKMSITPKPEKEAAIIWFLTDAILRDGGLIEDKIDAYLESLNF